MIGRGTAPNIGFLIVPRSCDDINLWQQLVQKLKDFRLYSLQESPEAFASTHKRERAFTDQAWADRLANPQATMLVAIPRVVGEIMDQQIRRHQAVQTLIDEPWMATTVLVQSTHSPASGLSSSEGPLASTTTTAAQEQTSPPKTMLFVLNGVYVAPEHRAAGVGHETLRNAFVVGKHIAIASGSKNVHFQVRVDSENLAAWKTYSKAGFRESSREQLMMSERIKDGAVLPTRDATIIVMEHVQSLQPS